MNDLLSYEVDETSTVPDWWDVATEDYIDMPQINGIFFFRDPFVGPPALVEVPDDRLYIPPAPPILRDYLAPGGVSGPSFGFGVTAAPAPIQPDNYLINDFTGVIGHHHITQKKWDCACWWDTLFG